MIKTINWILVLCCGVVLYLIIGVFNAVPALEDKYHPWGEQKYNRLLKKHGLHQKIAILQTTWDGTTYFMRDGKRYRFQ